LTFFRQVGAGSKNGDQTTQIEELKKKLAASEAKERDFGASSFLFFIGSSITKLNYP
jgi:hypothetical protein